MPVKKKSFNFYICLMQISLAITLSIFIKYLKIPKMNDFHYSLNYSSPSNWFHDTDDQNPPFISYGKWSLTLNFFKLPTNLFQVLEKPSLTVASPLLSSNTEQPSSSRQQSCDWFWRWMPRRRGK